MPEDTDDLNKEYGELADDIDLNTGPED